MKNTKVKTLLSKYAIYFVFVFLVLFISILNPKFVSIRVLRDILQQSSVKLIMAIGMMFIILSGQIDLSAGRMMGFVSIIAGSLAQTATYATKFYPNLPEMNPIVILLIGAAVGLLLGLINGLLTTRLHIAAFIATLGTQLAIYGICSLYYNKEPNRSQPLGSFTKGFTKMGSGLVGGIPIVLIIALVIALIVHIFVTYHRFGKTVFAVGGNPQAAIVSGINTSKIIVTVFALGGMFFGIAGVLEAARTGGATNNYGLNYEFDAISACVVGGVSMNGGVGAVPGVIIGVLIFQLIQYGMTFLGINPYWQNVVKGVIIIIAVAIDARKYIRKR